MAKNVLQDMKSSTRRPGIRQVTNIRQIKEVRPVPKEIPKKQISKEPELYDYEERKKTGSKYGLWFVAVICIIFFIFALSFLFARAEVTISPKTQDVTLNENLSAIKDTNASGLSFDLVVISGEESKKIAATGQSEISLTSKGTVIIYNAFSSVPQGLTIDTRLEGSNGKIYKTTSAVTVPGMAADGTPGQVEASIYGAEAGTEYNSSPLDFKIFGFKGTPKYAKFYGRSKGPITGGFKGMSPVVSEEQKSNTITELTSTLKTQLFQKASGQIPSGFILFKDAIFFTVDETNTDFTATDNTLPIEVKGTLYGFIFNEAELTKKIAEDSVTAYDDSDVYIPNIRELTFSLSNSQLPFSSVENINFTLSGPAKVVWKFDTAKLAGDLLGTSKKDFNGILSQYPNVTSANLSLSPFWARTLPSKSKDIKINVNYPK
jgi:hypothetical protein